jgi:hypothetical protein
MKKFVLALSALTLLAGSAPAFAAPCRDTHGKFIKCAPKAAPKAMANTKAKTCRDAKGHFAKCK